MVVQFRAECNDLHILQGNYETYVACNSAPLVYQEDDQLLDSVHSFTLLNLYFDGGLLPAAEHIFKIEVLHAVKAVSAALVVTVFAELCHVRSGYTFWNQCCSEANVG